MLNSERKTFIHIYSKEHVKKATNINIFKQGMQNYA